MAATCPVRDDEPSTRPRHWRVDPCPHPLTSSPRRTWLERPATKVWADHVSCVQRGEYLSDPGVIGRTTGGPDRQHLPRDDGFGPEVVRTSGALEQGPCLTGPAGRLRIVPAPHL